MAGVIFITAPAIVRVASVASPITFNEVRIMRFRGLALTAWVVVTPAAVTGQGDIKLALGGGISVPMRAFSDVVKKGWLGTGSLTYYPAASAALGLRLEGIYAHHAISIAEGTQTELGGLASGVFQFGARRSPNRVYVLGGGGYIRTHQKGPGFGEVSRTDPAVNLGAGLSFGARALGLFVEARYITVYTSGAVKPQFATLTGGISLGGL
jgi:hypothetical protein